MHCALCQHPMQYIHGHAACVNLGCPFKGKNQAECCDGETAGTCPAPTSALASVQQPGGAQRHGGSGR